MGGWQRPQAPSQAEDRGELRRGARQRGRRGRRDAPRHGHEYPRRPHRRHRRSRLGADPRLRPPCGAGYSAGEERKSTRLNSSHGSISYAVFCLKKKKKKVNENNKKSVQNNVEISRHTREK